MPSHAPIKTYQNRKRKGTTNSILLINSLLTKSISKRPKGRKKKPKITLKDLPPAGPTCLSNSSLNVNPNDTFDRLLKGKVFNNVKVSKVPKQISTDSTKSKSNISDTYYSPIMTRSRSKLRLASKEASSKDSAAKSSLDLITKSLSIEKMHKTFNFSSLSYIKIPNDSKVVDNNILSETFREQQFVHSSTPCTAARKKIVNDTMSPITNSKSLNQISIVKEDTPRREAKIRRTSKKFFELFEKKRSCNQNEFEDIPKSVVEKSFSAISVKDSCDEKGESSVFNVMKNSEREKSIEKQGFQDQEISLLDCSYKKEKSSANVIGLKGSQDQELSLLDCSYEKEKSSADVTGLKGSQDQELSLLDCSYEKEKSSADVIRLKGSQDQSDNIQHSNNSKTDNLRLSGSVMCDSSYLEVNCLKETEDDSVIIIDSETNGLKGFTEEPEEEEDWFKGFPDQQEKPRNLLEKIPEEDSDKSTNSSSIRMSNKGVSPDIIESSVNTSKNYCMEPPRKTIVLKSGKSYRRSLALVRRNSILPRSCLHDGDFESELDMSLARRNRRKTSILPVEEKQIQRQIPETSILENYARFSIVQREELLDNLNSSVQNLSLSCRDSVIHSKITTSVQNLSLSQSVIQSKITAEDVVLRRCGQTEVISFEEMYPPSVLEHCQKIGEGVYGEVFLYRKPKGDITVMKIIPVEGEVIVNGEHQKKFDEVLSEIIIAQELSKLRLNETNMTRNFSEVQNIRCTRGKYPEKLLELWDLYDENKNSENDSPEIFDCDQHYVILEFANGGYDLESYVFNSAQEAYSIFQQTACALAVAEAELSFEHRDLHWGNILVTKVDKVKSVNFCLEGQQVEIKTLGVEATIIDFTLSRLQVDGVVIFNDLSTDAELFSAEGDYQFEIYRLMQKSNGNKWQHFEPYTNILWLHYVLSKVPQFRYKNTKTKVHKKFSSELNKIKDEILAYRSVKDFARAYFFSNV